MKEKRLRIAGYIICFIFPAILFGTMAVQPSHYDTLYNMYFYETQGIHALVTGVSTMAESIILSLYFVIMVLSLFAQGERSRKLFYLSLVILSSCLVVFEILFFTYSFSGGVYSIYLLIPLLFYAIFFGINITLYFVVFVFSDKRRKIKEIESKIELLYLQGKLSKENKERLLDELHLKE